MTTKLSIVGMHCLSCKTLIEEVCAERPGVRSCSVDFDQGQATVEHDGTMNPADLISRITELGEYQVKII